MRPIDKVSKEKLEKGIQKYITIMDMLLKENVTECERFQKMFNGFYKIRQRKDGFYKSFYEYLETNKNNEKITFAEILEELYKANGSYEASFSSKMLATINPSMPILDSQALKFLGIATPSGKGEIKKAKCIEAYEKICTWYEEEKNGEVKKLVAIFNDAFPTYNISDVKKADFIIWSGMFKQAVV